MATDSYNYRKDSWLRWLPIFDTFSIVSVGFIAPQPEAELAYNDH